MPPKRTAMAQAIRSAFTEDRSVAEVEGWVNTTLTQADTLQKQVRDAQKEISGQTYVNPSSAETTPQGVLQLLQSFESLAHEVYLSAEVIRTVIEVRIPEFKEEDNLGVAVQAAVLKRLDGIQQQLAGNGEGTKPVAGMFVAKEYLSARATIEEKIIPKANTNSDKDEKTKADSSSGTKAPSAILELKQLDYDTLLKLELSIVRLVTLLRSFVNTYALNWKKLIQPRANTDAMTG